jgi:hypothetical protein
VNIYKSSLCVSDMTDVVEGLRTSVLHARDLREIANGLVDIRNVYLSADDQGLVKICERVLDFINENLNKEENVYGELLLGSFPSYIDYKIKHRALPPLVEQFQGVLTDLTLAIGAIVLSKRLAKEVRHHNGGASSSNDPWDAIDRVNDTVSRLDTKVDNLASQLLARIMNVEQALGMGS